MSQSEPGVGHPWLKFFHGTELLIAATRYYVGRRTIGTAMFAEHLAAAWPTIPENTQKIIRRDLEDEFRRDDCARFHQVVDDPYTILPLGDDCDRDGWEKVRQAWLTPNPTPSNRSESR